MPFLSQLASAKINAAEKYIGESKNFKHLFEDLVNPKKYIVGTMMLSEYLGNPKKYVLGTVDSWPFTLLENVANC